MKYLGLPVKMEMGKDIIENVNFLNQESVKAHKSKLGLPILLQPPRRETPLNVHLQASNQATDHQSRRYIDYIILILLMLSLFF
jgi:hypothetical protein